MHVLQQLLFIIALGLAGNLILRRAILIRDTIRLGRADKLTDQPGTRFKTMMRIAFAQKKMFDRPLAGILHFVVYAGFILINVEVDGSTQKKCIEYTKHIPHCSTHSLSPTGQYPCKTCNSNYFLTTISIDSKTTQKCGLISDQVNRCTKYS